MYDLIAIRLRRCKHDIAFRLPISWGIIEKERVLFNWENKGNSLSWPLGMNMIQIAEGNLKQTSLFKSLLRLP